MSEVVMVILQFMPLLILLLLANGAESPRLKADGQRGGTSVVLKVLSYIFIALTFLLMLLAGAMLHLFGLLAKGGGLGAQGEISGVDPQLSQTIIQSLPYIGSSFWIPSLVGILLLIPAVRRNLVRRLPLDPNNMVHTVSLTSSMFIWIYFFFFLSIGLDTISELTSSTGESPNPMPSLWAQQITFFVMALIGVGWLTRRNLRGSFRRLGLVRPTSRQVLIGIGSGLLLVTGALLLEQIANLAGFTQDPHVEKLTEDLLGSLYGSVWGILTLGLSAALGEEAIFRGALLPRFGLILTTLLFTVVHSNYGLSLSTLVVFLVGLALGMLRNRYNTTTTMVVHATYNITLGILASLYS